MEHTVISKIQIIDYFDDNDQKRRADFWIFDLNALEHSVLNSKRAQEKLHIVQKCLYMKMLVLISFRGLSYIYTHL